MDTGNAIADEDIKVKHDIHEIADAKAEFGDLPVETPVLFELSEFQSRGVFVLRTAVGPATMSGVVDLSILRGSDVFHPT